MPRGKSHVIRRAGLFLPLAPGDLVWAYLRHSPGEDQDIRSQREAVERYCRERGLTVACWFMDEGISGGSLLGRDQFDALLAASREQPPPVAGIVLWDLSRLSRDDLESQFVTADLRLRGYRIVSVHDDIPAGEFSPIFESFIRWKNARFLRDLQANVHRGIDSAIAARYVIDGVERTGFSCGGFPPVGYVARKAQVGTKKSGKSLVVTFWEKTPDPALRTQVQRAWDMAVAAARQGEMVRVGAVHRETSILRPCSYYDFYRHVTYTGARRVGDRLVEDAHESYVSQADFHLVQRFVARHKAATLRQNPRHDHTPFHLAGRVRCGYCGAPIWLEADSRSLGFLRMRCSRRQRDGAACTLASMSYWPFLANLVEALKTEVLTVERMEAWITNRNRRLSDDRDGVAKERQRLVKEIASSERVIGRLLDAVEAGHGASVRGRLTEREAELAALRARLAALATEQKARRPLRATHTIIESVLTPVQEDLESSDPEAVREALGVVVRRVDLYNDRAEVMTTLDSAALLLWPNRGHSRYPQGDADSTPDLRVEVPIVRRYRRGGT